MLGGRERLNMTHLALNLSHYVNGVALRHRKVSSDLFPRYEIHQITNGVQVRTWTSPSFRTLFDRHIPGWRDDPLMLHNALALPPPDVWDAHQRAADPGGAEEASSADAANFYRKLRDVIAPLFHEDRGGWVRVMHQCIALNASFFNTHRMVRQYVAHAYLLEQES